MQILKIKKGNLKNKVLVPPSKSYANRALIIASLLKKSPKLKNLPKATDVTILLNSLNKMGLEYEEKGEYLNFLNSFPECESEQAIKMEVGEGGTTARFLATMFLLGKSTYTLILGERLKHRPWDTFIDLARSLGANVSLHDEKLTINGPIEIPEKLEVDCTKTTQFASAFQLLTVIKKKSKITPINMTSSKSYWAMTEKMITDLCHCEVYEIPKDWSSASYPMAFAALNHQITFPGLTLDSFQADSKFAEILTSFQCIEIKKDKIIVHPLKKHHPVKFDVSDCLDLVPTLGYFLSHIEGVHRLIGIGNLVHKESDRLTEVIKLLSHFKRKAWSEGGVLYIEGKRDIEMNCPTLSMPNDHRMVMTAALFLRHHSGGEIGPKEAVLKSYPDFFELFE